MFKIKAKIWNPLALILLSVLSIAPNAFSMGEERTRPHRGPRRSFSESTQSLNAAFAQTTRTLSPEWQRFADAGRLSALNLAKRQFDTYSRYGIGILYGVESNFASLSTSEKAELLRDHSDGAITMRDVSDTSCIGWVMRHMRAAYEAAGWGDRYATIVSYVSQHDGDGTFLAQALSRDGWTAMYWNPDVTTPDDGDPEHTTTYQEAQNNRTYYGTHVDDFLINYRPTPGSSTVRDTRKVEKLSQVPFWYGIALGAYHTFVGTGAYVLESHMSKDIDSWRNVEAGHFANEWELKMYLSGMILVPPGSW